MQVSPLSDDLTPDASHTSELRRRRPGDYRESGHAALGGVRRQAARPPAGRARAAPAKGTIVFGFPAPARACHRAGNLRRAPGRPGGILAAATVIWLYLPRPDKVSLAAQT